MSLARLLPRTALLLLVLAWLARGGLGADGPVEATLRALEGRWPGARRAWKAWREPYPPEDRLDLAGVEVVLWRPTWAVDAQGRAAPVEDETLPELRRSAHRFVASGNTPPANGAAAYIGQELESLYGERMLREVRGMGGLPTGSPLATAPDPTGTIARFLALQQHVYHPAPPEQSSDAAWAAQAKAAREKAEAHRSRAHAWALLGAGLLLTFTLLLGWRLGRPPRS